MSKIILIIEDNDSIAELEKRYLERAGFTVLIAGCGKDGLCLIPEHQPALLIIDYKLPDMSGVEVMREAQELGYNIPSIIVTAAGNEQVAVSAMKLGAMDYIVKERETIKLLPEICSDVIKRFDLEAENRRLIDEMKLLNSQLLESNRRLDEISKRDDLTGCFNRRYLMETLSYETARSTRYSEPLSFAIFDIDHFKLINDTYGHTTGDLVLKQFVSIMHKRLRKTDILGRYGGEEFGLLLACTSLERAVIICNEIRVLVGSHPFGFEHSTFSVTTSAGVAVIEKHMRKEELIELADRALYKAKESGRDMVVTLQHG